MDRRTQKMLLERQQYFRPHWRTTKQNVHIFRAHLVACLIVIDVLLLLSPVPVKTTQFTKQQDQTIALKYTISQQSHDEDTLHLLGRLRRQANLLGASGQRSSSSGQAGSSGGASERSAMSENLSGTLESSSQSNQQEAPEVLTSFKCDFGSSEAPDLCKLKILDQDSMMNPLARTSSLSSWTLGSGRLALFQGGPLLDATGLQASSNETSGGYIFYETSNPFASAMVASNSSNLQDAYMATAHKHTAANLNPYGSPPVAHDQVITSQRVSVGLAQSHASANQNSLAPSSHQWQQIFAGPSFMSPNLTAPGPSGMCLSFQYAIQGLSAEELRIYLSDQKTARSRQIWASSESAGSNWTKGEVLYSVTNEHALVFSAVTSNAIVKDLQQRKFRGHLALDDLEIQKHDPLGGDQAACKGHCNFDGDLCGWTNGENGQEDDFDWSFGRGSDNLFTGPARDFTSSSNNEQTGSFLFTDSGYPRRPGDRALLLSPMFQPTAVNEAMCMRFAVHMFGSGIGSLSIKLRHTSEGVLSEPSAAAAAAPNAGSGGATGALATGQSSNGNQAGANQQFGASSRSLGDAKSDLVVWEMSGDAGNSWHQAQTSVSSSKSPFQVVIEGLIGENHFGNIALDEISFSQGPCPTSPPVASKNYGDCTFEQSMCYWRNPDADIHLDDLDWIRQADETSIHGPNFDHTLKKRSGSYLKLENTFREPKSGTRAFLLSPVFQPKASGSVQCLSFYYFMFMRSISSSGPNLGTIRVYLASNNELVPIWRLTNPISSPNWKHARASLSTSSVDGQPQAPSKLFQIAFEGIWGDAASGAIALDDITVFDGACDIMPAEARSVPGECTFDVDMCSWSNKSASYELGTGAASLAPTNEAAILDSSSSPFLQSVGSGAGGATVSRSLHSIGGGASGQVNFARVRMAAGWQLATVDSRPVNLQDHTYKAPIGYAYVDVLSSGGGSSSSGASLAYTLQSAEVTVQSGQQFVQCLSFWFAAYGRQETNQLSVHLTQASAPPLPPEGEAPAQAQPRNPQATQTGATADAAAAAASEADQANAWKAINGKLVWNIVLRNVTESQRRKWLYGQVTIKADSNHIIRFLALSNDGGFALDDVSYFDGACETRPSHARVQSSEDEAAELAAANPGAGQAGNSAGATGAGSTGGSAGTGGFAGSSSAGGGQRTR